MLIGYEPYLGTVNLYINMLILLLLVFCLKIFAWIFISQISWLFSFALSKVDVDGVRVSQNDLWCVFPFWTPFLTWLSNLTQSFSSKVPKIREIYVRKWHKRDHMVGQVNVWDERLWNITACILTLASLNVIFTKMHEIFYALVSTSVKWGHK